MGLFRISWVKLNHLWTGVGHFYSFMYRSDLAPLLSCECGATNQIRDHIISTCSIHWTPRDVAGLMVLDDNT